MNHSRKPYGMPGRPGCRMAVLAAVVVLVAAWPQAPACTAAAAPAGRAAPDLTFMPESFASVPASPHVGDEVTSNVTMANIGDADIYDEFGVSFFLDDINTTLKPADYCILFGYIGANETQNVIITWATGAFAPGDHTIIVLVDHNEGNQSVNESDETNNRYDQPITLLPRLLPQVSVSPDDARFDPPSPVTGDNVTVSVEMKNVGEGNARFVDVFFYLNDTGNPISSFVSVSWLNVSDSKNASVVWGTGGLSPGNYTVLVYVNPRWASNHFDEPEFGDNNLTLPVELLEPPVEMRLVGFNFTPDHPRKGDELSVRFALQNNGTHRITAAPVSLLWDEARVALLELGLSPGETADREVAVPTAGYSEGAHVLRLLAGPVNASLDIELLAPLVPDLVVLNLSFQPQTPKIGETVSVSVAVANIGKDPSPGCNLSLYADYGLAPVAVRAVPPIEPSGAALVIVMWNTTGMSDGPHRMQARVDAELAVFDANRTNNLLRWSINLTGEPDLAVGSVSISPKEPRTGDTVAFAFIVQNTGSLRSSGAEVFLDIEGTRADDQKLLPLATGGQLGVSLSWNTFGAFSGNHTFTVSVAAGPSETDRDPSNNAVSGTVTLSPLPPAPNLRAASAEISPPEPRVGDIVTLRVVIANSGDAEAGASKVMLTMENPLGLTLKFTDSPMVVPPIAAGRSLALNATRDTTGLVAGTYNLTVELDFESAVPEGNEADNDLLVPLVLLGRPPAAPVLAIERLYVNGCLAGGQLVSLVAVLNNTGDAGAFNITIRFYVDGVWAGKVFVDSVAAGTNRTVALIWMAEPGTHRISVKAWKDGFQAASSELGGVDIDPAPVDWIPYIIVLANVFVILSLAGIAWRLSRRRRGRAPPAGADGAETPGFGPDSAGDADIDGEEDTGHDGEERPPGEGPGDEPSEEGDGPGRTGGSGKVAR